jgi:hypothetical protein
MKTTDHSIEREELLRQKLIRQGERQIKRLLKMKRDYDEWIKKNNVKKEGR